MEFGIDIPAPPLTEDDAFGSHPQLGTLAYRLPSLTDLFQMPEEAFNPYDVLNFYVKISTPSLPKGKTLKCLEAENCMIKYLRSYTPVVFTIAPRVLFEGAMAEIWFDPKNTMSLIADLKSDDKPFLNYKLDGSLLIFEDTVDSETTFSAWNENVVSGYVGGDGLLPGNHEMHMAWENGYAKVMEETAKVCTVD